MLYKIMDGKRLTVLRGGLRLFFYMAAASLFLAATFGVALADELGDQQTFFVDPSYDYSSRSSVAATLKKMGSHGYFYAEDDYFNDLSEEEQDIFLSYLSDLAQDFNSTIYSKNRSVFGTEWSPGIDGDRKITVLLTKIIDNAGGYFNPNNEYLKERINGGVSNEREMVYLNTEFISDPRMSGFLAHEFQHLITWHQKTKLNGVEEDVWLNEGRSEYAPTANGFDDYYNGSNLKARMEKFKTIPDDSLTEWTSKIDDYPPVNLFIQYLVDRFGEKILKEMTENSETGIKSVNEALANTGNSKNFQDVYADWTVANYLNDTSIGGGKYGYSNPIISYHNFHLEPSSTTLIGNNTKLNSSASIKDWSSRRYEIKPTDLINDQKNTLEFSFNGGNSKNFAVPYVVFYRNGNKKVNYLELDKNQDGGILIDDFGGAVSKLTVIPGSQVKTSGFGNSEPLSAFSYSAKLTEPIAVITQKYPDGSLLQAEGDKKVYLIENGKKRWIASAAVFSSRYNWNDIQIVISSDLASFEFGEKINKLANGFLIKGSSEKVYLIENSKKRWIANAFTFNQRSYRWKDIYQISDSELNNYPAGGDISGTILYPDGTLIKDSGFKVYLIENGKKRWIVSAATFNARGYQWDKIIIVSNEELGWYLEGERME